MQKGQLGKPAVGIVFDTALSHVDDALAMALLYGFDGRKDVRVVSVSVSRSNLKAAMYADLVGRFYGRTLPVGLSAAGKLPRDEVLFTAPLAGAETDIHRFEDTAEVGPSIRNALSAQYDQNAVVVVCGPATNLAELLQMSGAKEMVARKVKMLVLACDVAADAAAARRVLAEWPGPVVSVGPEIGDKVLFPGASIEKDFAWAPEHPVVAAYKAGKSMPYDATTRAMAAVLYACLPQDEYFQVSEAGMLRVGDDSRVQFVPSPGGGHKSLIYDPAKASQITNTYVNVASSKPVARPQRVFPVKKAAEDANK